MQRGRTRGGLAPLLSGLAAGLIALILVALDPPLVAALRERVFDAYQRRAPRAQTILPVRVIEIDDAALARYGQWPWPRHRFATLADRLDAAGAAAIVFDVIFAEKDRTSPAHAAASWIEDPALAPARAALARAGTAGDHDAAFAAALARAPSVLHVTAETRTPDKDCPGPIAPARVGGIEPGDLIGRSFGAVVVAEPALREAAAGEGFARVALASDAVVRRAPMVARACAGSVVFPSLAVEAVRVAHPRLAADARTDRFAMRDGRVCRLHARALDGGGLADLRLCGAKVAADAKGETWIRYAGADASVRRRLDLAVALEGDPAALAQEVAGRIVILGASAEGLRDLILTPMGDVRPGAHVHAELIEQMLEGTALRRDGELMRPAEMAIGAALGLLLIGLLPSISAAAGVGALAVALAALFAGAFRLFVAESLLADATAPALIASAAFLGAFAALFQREQAARRFIRGAFGKFLAPVVVERLERDPAALRLEGEEREITALFSDIRDFTALSERLTPQRTSQLLNDYFTPMTRIVTAREGLVDKYVGDGMVAMWNAPLDVADHAERACRAALDMLAALEALNARWRQAGDVAAPVRIGIGLHTAVARVGNFGSEDRLQYSMLGDMVNLAARLEAMTKETGASVLVSAETRAHASRLAFAPLGRLPVRGRREKVAVFALVGDEAHAADPAFIAFSAALAEATDALDRGDGAAARAALDRAGDGAAFGMSEALARLKARASDPTL